MMRPFDFHLRTRVVFGDGSLARVGELWRELGFTRTLLVADRGVLAVGYVERAAASLVAAGIVPSFFHDFDSNPDTRMVEAGRAHGADCTIDSLVALGGGSSLDCSRTMPGGCSIPTASRCCPSPLTSRRAAPCCSELTRPGWRSSNPCSVAPMPARTR